MSLCMEFIPLQVKDFAYAFLELDVMPIDLFLLPSEVPLNTNPTIWCSSRSSQCCMFCKFAESSLCLTTQIIIEDVKQIQI